MIVTLTDLRDYSNFSDTDLHGFTQIPELNNTMNIFQLIPTNRTQLYRPGKAAA